MMYLFIPATASAPAGSGMDRVSMKIQSKPFQFTKVFGTSASSTHLQIHPGWQRKFRLYRLERFHQPSRDII
jgi:hypothetical protein